MALTVRDIMDVNEGGRRVGVVTRVDVLEALNRDRQ
jgi:CBS domain-containing protein